MSFLKHILFSLSLLCVSGIATAQTGLPNTTWPYVFDEFRQGTLHYTNTASTSRGLFNIHLEGNVLQYVNNMDDKVHKAETALLDYVEIDSAHYVVADGKMMQLMYSKGDIQLLMCEEADWDALFTYQGGAYGMNVTTASSIVTHPFDLAGRDRPLYSTLQTQKHDGREITTHHRYYISKGSLVIKANKKNVQQSFNLNAKQFKTFIKDNHIEWQSTESLKLIVDMIADCQ